MDNFDLKNYLVENKLTYQEKMKVKAEKNSLKEFDNYNPENDYKGEDRTGKLITINFLRALGKEGLNYEGFENVPFKIVRDTGDWFWTEPVRNEDKVRFYEILKSLRPRINSPEFWVEPKYITPYNGPINEKMAKVKPKNSFKENTGTGTKEKEKAHQAPKDKQKQGPSSLNEGKIFFGSY